MPLDWGDKDVIEKDGKLYYRNVFNFTNRIRVVSQTRDIAKLKQTLDTCLRGEAELWWNNQLDHIMRLGYLAATSLDHYCEALEARFRPPPSEALAKFTTTRYSVEDCRSRRSITEYLATLEAAAKACGLGPTSTDTQKFGLVIQAWMHLDLPLRETVDEPAPSTTLEQFAGTLLRKQNNWFDRFPPRGSCLHQPERPFYQSDHPFYQPECPDSQRTYQPRESPGF